MMAAMYLPCRCCGDTIDPLAFWIIMGLLVLGLAGITYLYLKSGGLYEHLDR